MGRGYRQTVAAIWRRSGGDCGAAGAAGHPTHCPGEAPDLWRCRRRGARGDVTIGAADRDVAGGGTSGVRDGAAPRPQAGAAGLARGAERQGLADDARRAVWPEAELRMDLAAAIAYLPPQDRDAVVLRDIEQRT